MWCLMLLKGAYIIEKSFYLTSTLRYAPGFKKSIVGKEVLPPPELEKVFGLTGGNIFHGSMSLDQLYLAR